MDAHPALKAGRPLDAYAAPTIVLSRALTPAYAYIAPSSYSS